MSQTDLEETPSCKHTCLCFSDWLERGVRLPGTPQDKEREIKPLSPLQT